MERGRNENIPVPLCSQDSNVEGHGYPLYDQVNEVIKSKRSAAFVEVIRAIASSTMVPDHERADDHSSASRTEACSRFTKSQSA